MTISGTLVVLGTATTNPAPNGISTVSPGTFASNIWTPSAAWILQAKPALFPLGVKDGSGEKQIEVSFVPSSGDGTTYTITMWQYNRLSGTWISPDDNAAFDFTGSKSKFIESPGLDPIFLQISNVSAGTVAIYFNGALARAL